MKKFFLLLFSVFLLGAFSPPDAEAFCYDNTPEIDSPFLNTQTCIDAPATFPEAVAPGFWHPLIGKFRSTTQNARKSVWEFGPRYYNTSPKPRCSTWTTDITSFSVYTWKWPNSKAFHYGEAVYCFA